MKFSIITVCRNSVATIRDAMASVAAQRTQVEKIGSAFAEATADGGGGERLEIEYLVIDGASTDGTVEAIQKFAQNNPSTLPLPLSTPTLASTLAPTPTSTFSFRWLSEPDNGMYDALNKGIRMASGDVIGILNADDVLDGDDVLARVAEAFASDAAGTPRLQCVYGNVRFVKGLGGRTLRVCFARWWRPWMLQWGYMPPHPAIFIRRECFAEWGGYVGDRKEYRIAADYELLIRFFRVNRMTHRYMKVCTTVMRMGGMSTKDVEARKKLNEEIVKGNRVNGYFCIWPMLIPKYAVKIWEVVLPRLGFAGR